MTPRPAALLSAILLLAATALAQQTTPPQPTPAAATTMAASNPLNEQLWDATRKGDAAAVKSLLAKGADVNARWRYNQTPLFKASERGHTEVVKVLLDAGADVNVRDTFYQATPLTWAIDKDHVEVVRALIDKGVPGKEDVLLAGTRGGNVEYVKIALAKGGLAAPVLTRAFVLAGIRHRAEKDEALKAKRTEIAELLKQSGAQAPFEVDAATLKSYEGAYKPATGQELKLAVNADGYLSVTAGPTNSFTIVATDKVSFQPVEFDGIQITFNVEGDKVTGFNFKQGQAPVQVFKRVEVK